MGLGVAGVMQGGEPPLQQAEWGAIDRVKVWSPEMQEEVTVDIWVPDSAYLAGPSATAATSLAKLPVIYMHDGQNLFDATTTWNGQSWEVDRMMERLVGSGMARPAIVVGVHSDSGKRVAELMPTKAVVNAGLDSLLNEVKLKGVPPYGDEYAAFLVKTLKPYVDARYNTDPSPVSTTVAGSSMGGLMSLYALCEYPETFGNALCLSTHWSGSPAIKDLFAGALYDYASAYIPMPTGEGYRRKLYFDHGTTTIDADYGPYEERVLEMVRQKGYDERSLASYVDEGAAHEENAWARRLWRPLLFLLGL